MPKYKVIDSDDVIIEAEIIDITTQPKRNKSILLMWWISISAKVRRFITRSKRRMYRMFHMLPHAIQTGFKWTLIVVGYLATWTLIWLSFAIAVSQSLLLGLGVVFLWCTIFAWFIERLEARTLTDTMSYRF